MSKEDKEMRGKEYEREERRGERTRQLKMKLEPDEVRARLLRLGIGPRRSEHSNDVNGTAFLSQLSIQSLRHLPDSKKLHRGESTILYPIVLADPLPLS